MMKWFSFVSTTAWGRVVVLSNSFIWEWPRSPGLVLIIMRDGSVAMLGLTLRWSERMRNPWVPLFSHFGPVIFMCNGWSFLQAAPYLEKGHQSFVRKTAGTLMARQLLCKSVWLSSLTNGPHFAFHVCWKAPVVSLAMRVNVSLPK